MHSRELNDLQQTVADRRFRIERLLQLRSARFSEANADDFGIVYRTAELMFQMQQGASGSEQLTDRNLIILRFKV